MNESIFLLKTSADANSEAVASFLSALPGAPKVMLTCGAYSFMVQASERANKGISRRLSENKSIESFELIKLGLGLD